MRYRKRISLGGGARVNLSKSGVSFSTGIKGLSLTTGKRGTYLNAGIPGTGIYDRVKLGGSNSKNSSSIAREEYGLQEGDFMPTHLEIKVKYDDDGSITLLDTDGNELTDPQLIKMIKAAPEYKEELARMTSNRISEYDEQMDQLINIQCLTPKVYSTEKSVQKIQEMKPREYVYKSFSEPKPLMADVVADLSEEAMLTIDVRSKRKRARLCERYVNETKEIEYSNRYQAWADRRAAFVEEEAKNKVHFDEEEQQRLVLKKQQFMQLAEGNKVVIDKAIDEWLATVQFPFDFNIEYEHVEKDLVIDLDLPEIEDLPTNKVQRMANGTAKFKPKTKKEIKEDYSKCVFGLALFFAGNFFNKALSAQNIIISGYTQRRNKKGDIVDDYIYSIVFDRSTFEKLDYGNNDPQSNCMKFKNRVLQNADMGFKTIIPFSNEDLKEEQKNAMS